MEGKIAGRREPGAVCKKSQSLTAPGGLFVTCREKDYGWQLQLGFNSLDRAVGSAVSALAADPTIFVVIGRSDGSVVYTSTELHELAKPGAP